jgi:hypothetical protein
MKLKFIFGLLILLGLSYQVQAQYDKDDDLYYWKVLSKVQKKTTFTEDGEILTTPVFSKVIENLEGKEIILKGYVIPADLTGGVMSLSAFPYSSCFFCGGAGPESVVEIKAATPIIYRLDKFIVLQGKLKLNRADPLRLMYILEDATYYTEK